MRYYFLNLINEFDFLFFSMNVIIINIEVMKFPSVAWSASIGSTPMQSEQVIL